MSSSRSARAASINLPAWSELLDIAGHERVLEIGCGDCSFLAALAPAVGELVGLEKTAPGAVGAHELLKTLGKPATLFVGSLMDFKDRRGFDVIVIRRGLEEVSHEQRPAWAQKIASLLKPGGLVYLADDTAEADLWLVSENGWHTTMIDAGLVIRREVMHVPAGLEMIASKPDTTAAAA